MKAAFPEKYYPDSRHNHAKKAITSPEQDASESFYEYWERFKKLVAQCPYYGLSGDDLLVNFCDGLAQQYQIMVNAATGGGVDNYSVAEANEIIERLAASTRNYGRSRGSNTLNSIETPSSSNHKLEKTVDDLTKMVAKLVGNNQGGAQGSNLECNFCQGPHPMETCPVMEEQGISMENVSAMMHGQADNTKRFDKMDADKLASDARVKNLEIQLGQLAQEMAKNNQNNSNSIPSTTFPPKENTSSMTLRKGRTLESPPKKKRKAKSRDKVVEVEEQLEEELVIEKEKETPLKANGKEVKSPLSNDKGREGNNTTKDPIEEIEKEYVVEVPFPHALIYSKRFERDEDLYETFRKCEVNIPLLNLLKGVPRYAKFLKELCTPRRNPRKGTHKVKEYSEDLEIEELFIGKIAIEDSKNEELTESAAYAGERGLRKIVQPAQFGAACAIDWTLEQLALLNFFNQ
ncbi:uncharacterized protein LOC141632965 [Silene latifolia]|uniref:uncharacterized protein LOC141632965 n=1 Tax=Silene latifolia TaxID=37657 RepID=UPI003D78A82C